MPRGNSLTDTVDVLIGRKIQGIRIELGLSRQQLAAKIGVTHQQLGKYEQAINRVTGGRLAAIAKYTGQKVSWFFEEYEDVEPIDNHPTRLHMEISRNIQKINEPKKLQGLNMLIRSIMEK